MNNRDQIVDSDKRTSISRWEDSSWFHALLITALILGVFFRLSRLGTKIYSHDEIYTSLYAAGYLGDEVFTDLWDGTVKSAEDIKRFLKPSEDRNITRIVSRIALYRPHQAPLFFMLAHCWMQLIGYMPAAMRGLAALFGCLSIPAMYWFGKEMFQSSRVALLATTFFAISPFHTLFAQDARPYSLWTLATILSSAALLRAMRKNNPKSWIMYSLTLILGVYSHQLFILVAIAHGCYFTGIHLRSHKNSYGGFIFACLFAFLAYIPWLFFVITRWQQAARQVEVLNMHIPWERLILGWIVLFSSPLIDLDFNSTVANIVPYFLRALMLILTIYAGRFLWKYGSHHEKLFLALIYIITASTFIILDLLFGGMRSITGRYFVPVNIATILVMAYFLSSRLDRLHSQRKWRILTSLLFLAGFLSNINSLYSETWWNKELGRVGIDFVDAINRDQSLLIVSGHHPTNLGDVLLLSLEVDPEMQFRLYEDPADIEYSGNYRDVFWFPGTYQEVEKVSATKGFRVRKVMPGLLWKIVGINAQ